MELVERSRVVSAQGGPRCAGSVTGGSEDKAGVSSVPPGVKSEHVR